MGLGLGLGLEVRTSAPMIWYLVLNLMLRYLPKPARAGREVAIVRGSRACAREQAVAREGGRGEGTVGCHAAMLPAAVRRAECTGGLGERLGDCAG